jgi:hypothetical protein
MIYHVIESGCFLCTPSTSYCFQDYPGFKYPSGIYVGRVLKAGKRSLDWVRLLEGPGLLWRLLGVFGTNQQLGQVFARGAQFTGQLEDSCGPDAAGSQWGDGETGRHSCEMHDWRAVPEAWWRIVAAVCRGYLEL